MARVAGHELHPPRTIGLSEGEHVIELSAPGHEPLEATIRVIAARGTFAQYALSARAKALPPPAPLPERVASAPAKVEAGARQRSILPWVLVGAGSALVLGGIGTTFWAASAVDDAEKHSGAVPGLSVAERRAHYDDARSSVETRATLTYALFGAGVAAAAAGVAWLILSDVSEATAAVPFPVIGRGEMGLALQGRF